MRKLAILALAAVAAAVAGCKPAPYKADGKAASVPPPAAASAANADETGSNATATTSAQNDPGMPTNTRP